VSKTVFLDRDGTLNREIGFFGSPDRLELLPGVPGALQRLHDRGYRLVITTNQSGIARGLYTERDLARVHERLHELVQGLPFAYLHCPHHPDAEGGDPAYRRDCACRKPKSGLLHQACAMLKGFGVSLEGSVVIGDSARDLLMANGLPLTKVLVASGKPVEAERQKLRDAGCVPDHEAADLPAAVSWLLEQ
jgi:D-glycero-D-manno-heptose 1,7-bisphosphate phosphatase